MLSCNDRKRLTELLRELTAVLNKYVDCTEEKTPQGKIIHGENCEKVRHGTAMWGVDHGWIHAPGHDGPYSAGRNWFCGRCHSGLTPEQACELLLRQARSKGGKHA